MEPELRIMFHVLLLSICFVCGLIVSFHKDGKLSTLQLGPYLTIIFIVIINPYLTGMHTSQKRKKALHKLLKNLGLIEKY